MLELRVVFCETRRAPLKIGLVLFPTGDVADELGQPEALRGYLDFLARKDAALANLLGEELVEVGEEGAQVDADEHRAGQKGAQGRRADGKLVAVEAAYGLAQSVDAIGEGEKGIDCLEEGHGHLDGVEAGGARNLQEGEQHAQTLADVLQGGGQHEHDAQVGDRAQGAHRKEREHVHRLHAQDQNAGHA